MRPDGSKTRLGESFRYALEGLGEAWAGRNFKIMAFVAVLAITLGLVFCITATQWLSIVFCIGAVLGAEAANTALEDVVDLSVSTYSAQAKRAKDVAACAVLILCVASFIIGCIIFIPYIAGAVF